MKKLYLSVTFVLLTFITACAQTQPIAKWKFQTQGAIRGGAVVNNRFVFTGSSDGNVYALNKKDGTMAWKFQTRGAITCTPALLNNVVVISSRDNFAYALDAETGKLLWKFQMQPVLPHEWGWEYFTACPVIKENRVYIGSGDGHLYALSMSDGKLIWKYKTLKRIRATPLIIGNTIYQPSFDGVLYVLNAKDGSLSWKFETQGAHFDSHKFGWDRNSIESSPKLLDSLLVFGSRDGGVYCVNINTHRQKWRFSYGPTWAVATPLIDNGTAYIGWSDNFRFSAIDIATGKEKWKYETGSMVYTEAVLRGNDIIVGSADYMLYCFDKNTGQKKWSYKTSGSVYASPVIDGETIYTGSDDGILYAIAEGERPYKVVYDEPAKKRYDFLVGNEKITPYLKERGFEQVDSAGLHQFLEDRIRDKAPSVIVFNYLQVPDNILGADPATGLIRQYLEAGGKIFWPGSIPNVIVFEKGNPVREDCGTAEKLLGIKYVDIHESGNYHAVPTPAGKSWGLPEWFTSTYSVVSADEGVIPLALDEYNRPAVWLKSFSSRPCSGFVSCRSWGWYTPITERDLDLIVKLATYGLE